MLRNSLIVAFFTITTVLAAQKYSNEFLNIGVGARAQAMGNAQAASVSDATAGFWNPAGIAHIGEHPQIAAMHAEWFAGIGKYDYLSLALPIKGSRRMVGASLIRFGIDDIPNTLSLYEDDGTVNYDNIVPFSAADYALLLTYAQPIGDKGLSVGGNAKIVHRVIGTFANSWGFGLDAGIQYRPNAHWHFGVVGKDLTTTFNAWRFNFTDDEKRILAITGNDIPIASVELTRPQIVLGVAYKADFGKVGILTEANASITTDGKRNVALSSDPLSLDPLAGMEISYADLVFIRLGINQLQQETDLAGNTFWGFHPNAGVGVRLAKFYLNYAFTNIGESANNTYSHVISLRLDIDTEYLKRAIKNAQPVE